MVGYFIWDEDIVQVQVLSPRPGYGKLVARLVPWGDAFGNERERFESELGESLPKPIDQKHKERSYGKDKIQVH